MQYRYCKAAGFSLVEVTMAIGIISVSLLTMLGLIPVGLHGLKSATEDTVGAQISQRISSELLLLPYSQIGAYVDETPLYYDGNGVEQDAENGETRYTVTAAELPTSFPGSAALQPPSALPESIRTLQLTITTRSGAAQSYVFHLPNRGE